MDQDPQTRQEILEAEYVDAEPMEGSEVYRVEQQQPHVRTYYSSGGCTPCCGPFGCVLTLVFLSYVFYEFEFVRAVALALIVFMVISILAGSVVRRPR